MPFRRYDRLKYGMAGRKMQRFNHALVSIVSFLHVAPRGVKEVSNRQAIAEVYFVDDGHMPAESRRCAFPELPGSGV